MSVQANPTTLLPDRVPLWRHQDEAIEFALSRHGTMLAMAMGTGKSRVAIEIIERRNHRLTVITCPKSVQANWPREFSRHGDPARPVIVEVLRGSVAEKTERAKALVAEAAAMNRPLVLVINHEGFWRQPFLPWVASAGVDCLVVDELHRAKARGGKFSLALGRLAIRIPWRLGLTGTPMPHSPLDVYAQCRFLAPALYGLSFTRFRTRYAVMGGFDGKQVIGYQNERDLYERFARIAYQADASVVTLPEAVHVRREVELSAPARRVYRELEREFYAEVESGSVTAANALTRLLRLQQITGGTLALDSADPVMIDMGKHEALAEILADLPAREPVVVFARFRADLDAIHTAARSMGRTSGELSGRANDLGAWQAGGFDVLATQIQAGGVGVDLTRARYCVYYSLGFSLAEYLQSLARTHRPGQTRSVVYLHLVASQTIDERVYQALERRQKVVDAILSQGKVTVSMLRGQKATDKQRQGVGEILVSAADALGLAPPDPDAA